MDEAEREKFAGFLLRMRGAGLDRRDLIAAIEATPRTSFVPSQWRADAWSDRSVPIECGETIEGIDLQMQALAALDLQPGCRVLEIGTGSGYTAAVMARLSARVLTLDRYKTLVELARQRHEALGISNIIVRQADGTLGAPAEGPFDRIIVWASYEELPRSFVDQISTGGVMVAAVGPAEGTQVMEKLAKLGSRFERTPFAQVRFQPMASGVAAAI
ncbi:protein-L-isoaspartate(D-aspartate) O-methyltransferase [Mesorhizobium microcysteis]|jgi:protein-L-isoaspartate(D-aspartate) O-methyltransferase|uniref:Protein-L-isoaspartate O-methyltransferase n=1 Tax=Neoaquamicrobium microcysteis TaxID=2682781 RepID=A0A5D4GWS4_9HYPH|nr:protein-L-isoaspartate(D-aspartate) O-methyltransferase [Mesorhizobium microcysteis]TYR31010.1 protein-L-isoaspartate(D-aspartate) O-methyltransferase [Mesorhizobium microcysteis]